MAFTSRIWIIPNNIERRKISPRPRLAIVLSSDLLEIADSHAQIRRSTAVLISDLFHYCSDAIDSFSHLLVLRALFYRIDDPWPKQLKNWKFGSSQKALPATSQFRPQLRRRNE